MSPREAFKTEIRLDILKARGSIKGPARSRGILARFIGRLFGGRR